MKILDWFKNLLKIRKKDYMLNEENKDNNKLKNKTDFVQKIDVNAIENSKSREDIFISLLNDIIVEDLSEHYNYTKFSSENIRAKYDNDSILSKEDITALGCLYGAIKQGNMDERKMVDNKINTFLKQNPNNIVILINLMINDAKSMYESIEKETSITTSVEGLIPGSYSDISEMIEKYNKENELSIE